MQNSQILQLTPAIFIPKCPVSFPIFAKKAPSQKAWIKPCILSHVNNHLMEFHETLNIYHHNASEYFPLQDIVMQRSRQEVEKLSSIEKGQ